MTKLETITADVDNAVRGALMSHGIKGDLSINILVHHTPIIEGVHFEKPSWANEDSKVIRAVCELGKWPSDTQLTLFPSIPDTQLATDEDSPF